ncbi:hypothetical protein [Actinophytocola xanthii]|uniref:Uncharacterized protein n=1 Tax=Actinophytocola xanthii TaxID=1912961 RepID=A0A1Q8C2I0_9PSEU|nr:hypothetical protein [Actinophytocola xanthii]OLF08566.1 hypothetical protein BU204_34300 [Actinophytocola xanthii]
MVYGVCISTDHTVPEPIIRAACADLAHRLDPGTCIDLATGTGDGGDGGVLAYIEPHPFPVTGC